jgi:hypothetical protein
MGMEPGCQCRVCTCWELDPNQTSNMCRCPRAVASCLFNTGKAAGASTRVNGPEAWTPQGSGRVNAH